MQAYHLSGDGQTASQQPSKLPYAGSTPALRSNSQGRPFLGRLFYFKKVLTLHYMCATFLFMSSPTSIRLTKAGTELWKQLSEALGLKRSAVMELAIRELAKKNGIKGEAK